MTKTLYITEMFGSIQGESTYAGRLCFFIRLAGCNLHCHYCDTDYSLKRTDGKEEDIDSIVAQVLENGFKLVEITGGEPLNQKNVIILCEKLLNSGCEVMIETNGSLDISVLPEDVIRIVDCKTPSSGEEKQMLFSNFNKLTKMDEVKFVIGNRKDYDYTLKIIDKYKLSSKAGNILLSPVWGKVNPADIVDWMLIDRPEARLQIQMHKIIWDPEMRGV